MYRTSINFFNRVHRGEIPTIYCVVSTNLGDRAYSEKELGETFDTSVLLMDGTITADGSELAGGGTIGWMEKSGRVLSWGALERTVIPRTKDVVGSLDRRQLQHISITLDNHDRYFSQLLPKEPFLTKTISIYAGFEADPYSEHLQLFSGVISAIQLNEKMVVEADEE